MATAQVERKTIPRLSIYPGYDGSARAMGLNHSPGSVFAEDFSFSPGGRSIIQRAGRGKGPTKRGKSISDPSPSSTGGRCRPSVNTIAEIERGKIMNWNWALAGAITTLVIGSWNFGMAGERPVIRAQGGMVYPESYPGYHEGEYVEDCEEGHASPFGKIHHCWTYITTLGGKQAGYSNGYGANGYGSNGYGPNGFGGGAGDPRQMDYQYLYRYRAPQNLRYPAANQPAGVVVYPYYTVKGPDDFFLNE
jgi:hypothetical protein